ncbi:hypothetical protein EVAR_45384_1 [Eumeta japonica]|uniref:Uncharacterized protein n=1 Tax=Eumeta variegata TaxID=151549 RepID=A0A4C1WQD9_EUMVA|nr:hypothetical protein EVAR_45384_1 [Eumeta japonica]
MFFEIWSLSLLCWAVSAFPDGAPVDACVKDRPNQPNHGQARTQPLSTLPYRVAASSAIYRPNSVITGVRIQTAIEEYVYTHRASSFGGAPVSSDTVA